MDQLTPEQRHQQATASVHHQPVKVPAFAGTEYANLVLTGPDPNTNAYTYLYAHQLPAPDSSAVSAVGVPVPAVPHGSQQHSPDLVVDDDGSEAATAAAALVRYDMTNVQVISSADVSTSEMHQHHPLLQQQQRQRQQHPAAGDSPLSASQQRHLNEGPSARQRRMARNAERLRERRSNESLDDYQLRLRRMAQSNRAARERESDVDRTLRQIRAAASQRIRRAMESPEQREQRLAKLVDRARLQRLNETPEERAERQRRCLENNRARFQGKANDASPTSSLGSTGTGSAGFSIGDSNGVSTSAGGAGVPYVDPGYLFQSYLDLKPGMLFPELPPNLTAGDQPSSSGIYEPGASNTSLVYTATGDAVPVKKLSAAAISSIIGAPPLGAVQPVMPSASTVPSPQALANFQQLCTPTDVRGRPPQSQRPHSSQLFDPELTAQLLQTPRPGRGRPPKGPETPDQRAVRLRRMADQRAAARANETAEERAARLRDLAERARRRRDMQLNAETAEERAERLRRQSEYARVRLAIKREQKT